MKQTITELKAIAAKTPVVILAGGLGTRLSEETANLPKPMVEIGGLPIILHLMDSYARFGFRDFVICGGYKIEVLKNYFQSLPMVGKDVEVKFSHGTPEVNQLPSKFAETNRDGWTVTVLETGLNAMTGARVRKAVNFLQRRGGFERVCLTYGDGLTDANFLDELTFHLDHGKMGTVLGVHPPTRFGIFEFEEDTLVKKFAEKPQLKNEYINGGFFILNKGFEKFLDSGDDRLVFELEPLEALASARQMHVYRHEGFWQCMDTKREKTILEDLYATGKAGWLGSGN
ncbi:MAG: sugar phosphate nucleotidyltransferase [Pseudomonadota bacterium]